MLVRTGQTAGHCYLHHRPVPIEANTSSFVPSFVPSLPSRRAVHCKVYRTRGRSPPSPPLAPFHACLPCTRVRVPWSPIAIVSIRIRSRIIRIVALLVAQWRRPGTGPTGLRTPSTDRVRHPDRASRLVAGRAGR